MADHKGGQSSFNIIPANSRIDFPKHDLLQVSLFKGIPGFADLMIDLLSFAV
jgi:hypothetical protein